MKTRELARITEFELYFDDIGGLLSLYIHFEYESGKTKILDYTVDISFIMRLMIAIGVKKLSELKNAVCYLIIDNEHVEKIEPLFEKDGKPFIISEWLEWVKKYHPWSCDQLLGIKIEDEKTRKEFLKIMDSRGA